MAAYNRQLLLVTQLRLIILLLKKRKLVLSQMVNSSKPKRLWVRTIMSEREKHSQFYVLVCQLQVHDREYFFRYLRMSPNSFEHHLKLVAPFIQKKKCRSRRPLSSAERLLCAVWPLVHFYQFLLAQHITDHLKIFHFIFFSF